MDVKTKLLAGTIRQLRASRERIVRLIAKIPDHIDDHDLERYHLGMVKEEAELAALEEHLLWCGPCVDRTEAASQYVDTVRAAACDRAEYSPW